MTNKYTKIRSMCIHNMDTTEDTVIWCQVINYINVHWICIKTRSENMNGSWLNSRCSKRHRVNFFIRLYPSLTKLCPIYAIWPLMKRKWSRNEAWWQDTIAQLCHNSHIRKDKNKVCERKTMSAKWFQRYLCCFLVFEIIKHLTRGQMKKCWITYIHFRTDGKVIELQYDRKVIKIQYSQKCC